MTNTIASDARNDLYREINMGPQPIVGGYGEARPFSAKEVRSVFFVVMCLMWLPDYLFGHSTGVHVWWKDDEVAHAQGVLILGHRVGGGVQPTSLVCNFHAKRGASLLMPRG